MNIISSNITASVQSLYFNEVSGELETIWLSTEKLDVMTKFGVAPMAGALYDVSDQLMLNFNLRYDYISAKDKEYGFNNATFLGITFGAMFKF
jgi:opacity protein-like surface antigen